MLQAAFCIVSAGSGGAGRGRAVTARCLDPHLRPWQSQGQGANFSFKNNWVTVTSSPSYVKKNEFSTNADVLYLTRRRTLT